MFEATNELALRKVFEHAEAVDKYCAEHGMVRIFTALFGSQNYHLDNEYSDVDTKSIVVPSVYDWLWSTEGDANYVLEMPDGSHAEMKPVVGMFKQFLKGNANFIEMLYTPYVDIAEDWEWFYDALVKNADNICRHNMYRQARAWLSFVDQMAVRTLRSSKSAIVNPDTQMDAMGYRYDLGYNPKAFMNFLRLKETFTRYFHYHRPFDEATDMTDRREELLKVKSGALSREAVDSLLSGYDRWIQTEHDYITNHYEDKEVWDAEKYLRDLALEAFLRTVERMGEFQECI